MLAVSPKTSTLRASDVVALPLHRQLQTCEFALAAFFIVPHVLRQGFMMTTIGRRAEVIFGPESGASLEEVFSIALPLGFLPMLLLTACGVFERLGRDPVRAFAVVSALSMVW